MPTKVLATYPDRCVGCRICQQWCSLQHGGAMNPALSRIIVRRDHRRCVNTVAACDQCADALCVAACPADVLRRDPVTGGLALDAAACIGCRLCLEACPRGVIRMDGASDTPLVCDLCGGDPRCVSHCPEGAVQFVDAPGADQAGRAGNG